MSRLKIRRVSRWHLWAISAISANSANYCPKLTFDRNVVKTPSFHQNVGNWTLSNFDISGILLEPLFNWLIGQLVIFWSKYQISTRTSQKPLVFTKERKLLLKLVDMIPMTTKLIEHLVLSAVLTALISAQNELLLWRSQKRPLFTNIVIRYIKASIGSNFER